MKKSIIIFSLLLIATAIQAQQIPFTTAVGESLETITKELKKLPNMGTPEYRTEDGYSFVLGIESLDSPEMFLYYFQGNICVSVSLVRDYSLMHASINWIKSQNLIPRDGHKDAWDLYLKYNYTVFITRFEDFFVLGCFRDDIDHLPKSAAIQAHPLPFFNAIGMTPDSLIAELSIIPDMGEIIQSEHEEYSLRIKIASLYTPETLAYYFIDDRCAVALLIRDNSILNHTLEWISSLKMISVDEDKWLHYTIDGVYAVTLNREEEVFVLEVMPI